MKKRLFLSLMMSAALLVASCSDDPETLNPPAAAGTISGVEANTCPEKTVTLSIGNIEGATSYQWYKNGTEITGATSQTYEVTATAAYTVAGINNDGAGAQSPAKNVTIVQCNVPANAGTIAGPSLNECGENTVRLSIAPIDGATSYQWYKDDAAITGATDTVYIATQSGSYTVEGTNINGTGAKSPAKVVTISDCVTINGNDVNACGETSVTLSVTIDGATSYQWYKDGIAISGATASTYSATASGTYSVDGFKDGNKCGQGRDKVVNIYTTCRTDVVGSYTLAALGFQIDTQTGGIKDGRAASGSVTISIDPDNENGVVIAGLIPPAYNDETLTLKAIFNRDNKSLSLSMPQIMGSSMMGGGDITIYPVYYNGETPVYNVKEAKVATLTYDAAAQTYTMDLGYNTWNEAMSSWRPPMGNVKPGTFVLTKN